MDDLKAATDAAKRGDAKAAVRLLLTAWQTTHHPAVAEALERISTAALTDLPGDWDELAERRDEVATGQLIDQLRDGNAAQGAARVDALGWVKDDPRAAAAIVRLVANPPFHSTGAKPFWTRLFTLLEANADPRSIAALAPVSGRLEEIIHGNTMRQWMQKKVEDAHAALAKRFAGNKTDPQLAKLAQAIELKAGAKPAPAKKSALSESQLFAAVYAAPDDDGPRSVLADFLTERGDVRGEFITLQLRRTDNAPTPRESALLPKNQPAWLGDLGSVVRYKNSYVYGPLPESWGMYIMIRWHRGFLAGANLMFSGAKLKKMGPLPVWATVEHALIPNSATLDPAALGVLLTSMRGLRSFSGHMPLLRAAAKLPHLGARLQQVNAWLSDGEVQEAVELIAGISHLRRLEVRYTSNVAPIIASPLWSRLEELRVSETAIRRDGKQIHVTTESGGKIGNYTRELLAGLPSKDVVSFTVSGYQRSQAHLDLGKAFPNAKTTFVAR